MACSHIDGIALLDALSAKPQQADDPATADGLCSAVYEGNFNCATSGGNFWSVYTKVNTMIQLK